MTRLYEVLHEPGRHPIKSWTRGVSFDDNSKRQLQNLATHLEAVNCHHNYIRREHHYGADVWVTRKGAVSAKRGEMGIIPAAWEQSRSSCTISATPKASAAAATARAA